MREDSQPFIICLHDVCPWYKAEVHSILHSLFPLVGNVVSAAVIPRYHGQSWPTTDKGLVDRLQEHTREILLHGLVHHRPLSLSPWSWFVHYADEFAVLSAAESTERICRGQAQLAELFGRPAQGFVAPAWQMGKLNLTLLERSGLQYWMGISRFVSTHWPVLPLASWSWDCGRVAQVGWLGEWLGHLLRWRSAAVPCVVIHPADIRRGYLARAIRIIQLLLAQGYYPTLPSDFLVQKATIV